MTDVPIREERKVVTALFADVVGSTAIAERLDPEDVREIVGEAIARIIQASEALGGTVKDLAGDGALILFGAPVAHEDDPERAVRAGLEIVKQIGEYRSELAARSAIEGFGVRVGIESGLVVLGPVGAGSRVEYGATGDAVNTAARLQSHAEPGTVLVGEATRRVIEPLFDWSEPRVLSLKGKAEPIRAWEAMGVRALPGRLRGLEGADVELVGRHRELAVLRSVAEALLSGRGGILVVTGEAGLGKSRLLRELRSLLEPGTRWLEGRCVSYGATVPYWPFRELLYQWLELRPEGSEALGRKVAEVFPREADDVLPFLEALLGEAPAWVAGLSGESLQRGIVESVKGLLHDLARRGPVAVALEDVHWADHASLNLAHRLLPVTEAAPILLTLTSRSEKGHPSQGLLRRALAAGRAQELRLYSLIQGADRELLATLIGEDILPEAVERQILEQAGGNPFYLEEIVRSLVDSGALRRQETRWRFTEAAPVEVPETVEKVILARLDRLPTLTRDVLNAASVVGRSFDLPLVEAVASVAGSILAAVDDLERLDLIRREAALEPTYRFKHVLIQEAAYRSLLRRRRRELHLRAAEALEARFSDRPEGEAALLGRHYRAAGKLDRAFELLHRGARLARTTYAVQEALQGYSEALEVAEELGASDRQVAELRLERGEVRAHAGDIEAARDDLEAAVSGARAAADRSLEASALGELGFLLAGAADYRRAIGFLEEGLRLAEPHEDRPAQVRMLSRLCIVSTNLLQFEEAASFGDRALALARGAGDERLVAQAMDALKQVVLQLGDSARLAEFTDELLRVHQRHQDLWLLQFVHFERAYVWLGTGQWERAMVELRKSLEINARIGDRGNEPLLLATLGRYHGLRGEYGRALEVGRRALDLAGDVRHTEWISWSELMLGTTLLELQDLQGAERHLEQATVSAEAGGALLHLVRASALLGWCRWRRGDREEALRWTNRAGKLLVDMSTPPGTANLPGSDAYSTVADVRLRDGDPNGARDLLIPLVAAATAQGWAEAIARASVVLGRCEDALGWAEPAEAHLIQAAETARGAGLPARELEAHSALAALYRAGGRLTDAGTHVSLGKAIVEALSPQITDESIRAGFVTKALAGLEEGEP